MSDQDFESWGNEMNQKAMPAGAAPLVQEESKTEVSTEASKSATPAKENPEYSGDKGLINLVMERDTPIALKPVAELSYGRRIRIAKLHQSHEQYIDHIIQVCGWARTTRDGGKRFFIELHDGSCAGSIQVVVDPTMPNYEDIITCKVSASFKIRGKLIVSPAKGQAFELQVCQPDLHEVHVFGKCDAAVYPLSKKAHSDEFLRANAHLRPRVRQMAAVTRVRNNLAYATHTFFQERGFQYIHTPIITASDCEGAGEMFQVTTVLPAPEEPVTPKLPLIKFEGQVEEEERIAKLAEAQKLGGNKKQATAKPEGEMSKSEMKRLAAKAKKEAMKKGGAAPEHEKKPEAVEEKIVEKVEEKVEEKVVEKVEIPMDQRKINYRDDFFSKPSYLTVSGQLSVENYCCAVGDVYTFGPTFRAENSHTARHLAEFWMIEPEIAFATLEDDIDLAEDYLKYCLRYVLKNNADDLAYFNKETDKGLVERLEMVASAKFIRVSYTECIEILTDHMKKKLIKFKEKVEWGSDMNSEHERYLTEKVYKSPIVVYNYPKAFKAFYMKQNDGEEPGRETVQAMDMLVPEIGELMGGSVREENLEKLDRAIKEKGLELDPYWWYRQLRMYGTQPHAGFGLGFERLVMMCTGVHNIRDVIPFPRYPKNAEF